MSHGHKVVVLLHAIEGDVTHRSIKVSKVGLLYPRLSLVVEYASRSSDSNVALHTTDLRSLLFITA